jgi:hypothetical protein
MHLPQGDGLTGVAASALEKYLLPKPGVASHGARLARVTRPLLTAEGGVRDCARRGLSKRIPTTRGGVPTPKAKGP